MLPASAAPGSTARPIAATVNNAMRFMDSLTWLSLAAQVRYLPSDPSADVGRILPSSFGSHSTCSCRSRFDVLELLRRLAEPRGARTPNLRSLRLMVAPTGVFHGTFLQPRSQFDHLLRSDQLHAGRAGYSDGFAALNAGLQPPRFWPSDRESVRNGHRLYPKAHSVKCFGSSLVNLYRSAIAWSVAPRERIVIRRWHSLLT
jgi:hypothetical protein